MRKMYEHRNIGDTEKLKQLEVQLKEARTACEEADKKYDEVRIEFDPAPESNEFVHEFSSPRR